MQVVENCLLLSNLESRKASNLPNPVAQEMVEPDEQISHIIEAFEGQAEARKVALVLKLGAPRATIATRPPVPHRNRWSIGGQRDQVFQERRGKSCRDHPQRWQILGVGCS